MNSSHFAIFKDGGPELFLDVADAVDGHKQAACVGQGARGRTKARDLLGWSAKPVVELELHVRNRCGLAIGASNTTIYNV